MVKKLSIIIPVYNEKETILEILRRLEKVDFGWIAKEVVIVDDCSTDGTQEIIRQLAGDYKVIYHEKNLGKGAAIRSGLLEVAGDYVVIQDADLEYDPQDLARLVKQMITDDLSVLYGSRRLLKGKNKSAGLAYYGGGVLLSWLTNILYGQKITDEPTCYKMFKTELVKSLPLRCQGFEFCPEVTSLVARAGFKIKEMPIAYYPRGKKEGKKINWRDWFEAAWVLIKNRF